MIIRIGFKVVKETAIIHRRNTETPCTKTLMKILIYDWNLNGDF